MGNSNHSLFNAKNQPKRGKTNFSFSDGIENAIQPSAPGKKNWLFVGHPEAGERSTVIYTLLGGCRRHGINPFDYLRDLLARLPAANIAQISQFTPAAWARANNNSSPVGFMA